MFALGATKRHSARTSRGSTAGRRSPSSGADSSFSGYVSVPVSPIDELRTAHLALQRKPQISDPNVYSVRIPDSRYAIRIWDGGMGTASSSSTSSTSSGGCPSTARWTRPVPRDGPSTPRRGPWLSPSWVSHAAQPSILRLRGDPVVGAEPEHAFVPGMRGEVEHSRGRVHHASARGPSGLSVPDADETDCRCGAASDGPALNYRGCTIVISPSTRQPGSPRDVAEIHTRCSIGMSILCVLNSPPIPNPCVSRLRYVDFSLPRISPLDHKDTSPPARRLIALQAPNWQYVNMHSSRRSKISHGYVSHRCVEPRTCCWARGNETSRTS